MSNVSSQGGAAAQHHNFDAAPVVGFSGRGLPTNAWWLIIVSALLLAPWALPEQWLHALSAVLVLGLFALSFALLLGYAGLKVMGHAAFMALGAYTAGIIALRVDAAVWITLPAAALVAGLVGLAFGTLALRTAGLQFMMISLAFGGLIESLIDQFPAITGGHDGLSGIPAPRLVFWPGGVDLLQASPHGLYYLIAAVTALIYFAARALTTSPLGVLVVGIRDNPRRVLALGMPVRQYQIAWFAIGCAIAGLAGALHVYLYSFVATSLAGVFHSVQGLIMVIIGGKASLLGAFFGAGVLFTVTDHLSNLTERWNTVLGLLFIGFILLDTKGGLGNLAARWLWRRS